MGQRWTEKTLVFWVFMVDVSEVLEIMQATKDNVED